jgi:hypothetical protein
MPQSIDMNIAMDQTVTIRASVHDVERSLLISVALVVLVVFVFLRSPRSTFIPSVAVPVSLIGTFGVMYLLHYSIDNLSLMALTISTGFVVDDAIVVIENITRYLEQGMHPFQAALKGAKEISFTVLSMSTSLIAVFIPLLLMGGIVGRLFREFAVTLSVAIAVSLVVSLTTTPMMCAHLLEGAPGARLALPPYRAGIPGECRFLRRDSVGRAARRAAYAGYPAGDHWLECVPVHSCVQGILSDAGQRAHDGRHSRRSGHLVSIHGQDPAANDQYRARRPGHRHGGRIHGRRHVQYGAHVCVAEAHRAKNNHRPGDRAAAAPSWAGYRGPRSTCRHRKICGWADA